MPRILGSCPPDMKAAQSYQIYFSRNIKCISQEISNLLLKKYKMCFSRNINYQMYFSININYISQEMSIVFLKKYQMYFSRNIKCISQYKSIKYIAKERYSGNMSSRYDRCTNIIRCYILQSQMVDF